MDLGRHDDPTVQLFPNFLVVSLVVAFVSGCNQPPREVCGQSDVKSASIQLERLIATAGVEIENQSYDRANTLLADALDIGQKTVAKFPQDVDAKTSVHDDRGLKLTFADVQQQQGHSDIAARERYAIARGYVSEIRSACHLAKE